MAVQKTAPIVYVGVDPGALGGIAVLCGSAVSVVNMPRCERSTMEYFRSVISDAKGVVGGLEQVGGYIKGNPAPGSAMFEFGENYGGLKMALVACGLAVTKNEPEPGKLYLIPPQEWMRGLGIDPKRKAESNTDWKRRLLHNAEAHFPKKQYPNLRLTLRTCDALLVALYTKRRYTTG